MRRLARHLAEGVRHAGPFGDQLGRTAPQSRIGHDLQVRSEKGRLAAEPLRVGPRCKDTQDFFGQLESRRQPPSFIGTRPELRSRRGTTQGGKRTERPAFHDRSTGQRDLARPCSGASRALLSHAVEKVGMAHRGTDARRQRGEQLDVLIAERNAASPLHREHAQGARSTEHRHRGVHREIFLTELGKMSIAEVLLGNRHRDRAGAFDDGSGNSFADRKANLP